MRPIATDVARSTVCAFVCLCVGHTGELCKKRLNWSRCRLALTHLGTRKHVLDGVPDPHGKGRVGACACPAHAADECIRRARIVTFFGRSEDLCLLRWQNLKNCRTWCFGNYIPNGTTRCSVFAKEFAVFVPNAISHYGRPSQFALICFNARRLDNLASLLVPHNLESWISHPKESEPNLFRCFATLIGRRSFGGFGYFSASLINLTKGVPK